MDPQRKGRRTRQRSIWPLLIPAVLLAVAPLHSTSALFSDQAGASSSLGAASLSPPGITPGTVSLQLRVGDRCVDAPLFMVTNTSPWSMNLSVTADGWLEHPASVAVVPSELGPFQSASVIFTKAAVQGPTDIHANVRVTADGYVTDLTVTGRVDNPAGAAVPGYVPPPGCASTPRSNFSGTLAPGYSFDSGTGDLITPDPWVLGMPDLTFPGDGTMHINADGRILRPDGTVQMADGSVQMADGSVQMPDGSVQMPDGSVQMPDGSVQMPDGSVQLPDGSVQMPDGSVQMPDGSVVAPEPEAPAPEPEAPAPEPEAPAPEPEAPAPEPEAPAPEPEAPAPEPEAPAPEPEAPAPEPEAPAPEPEPEAPAPEPEAEPNGGSPSEDGHEDP